MNVRIRTTAALGAAFALALLPGAAFAQEAGCVVVDGEGSAAGDVECPPERGVGGVVVDRPEDDQGEANQGGKADQGEVGVSPGRIGGADAAPDAGDDAPAVESVESTDAELAATGAPADVAAVAALAALTLGGGALVAARRRQRTHS